MSTKINKYSVDPDKQETLEHVIGSSGISSVNYLTDFEIEALADEVRDWLKDRLRDGEGFLADDPEDNIWGVPDSVISKKPK